MSLIQLSPSNGDSLLINSGSFITGKIIRTRNELVFYTDQYGNSTGYRWLGNLPHTINGNSPQTDGGISSVAWESYITENLYDKLKTENITLTGTAHLPTVEVAYGLRKGSLKVWVAGSTSTSHDYWLYSDGTVWSGVGTLGTSPNSPFTQIHLQRDIIKYSYVVQNNGETIVTVPYDFSSIVVYVNGVLQSDTFNSYSINNRDVIFSSVLNVGDIIQVFLDNVPISSVDYALKSDISNFATKTELKSDAGASVIGLHQGGSVQDAISFVTPEMSGIITGEGNEKNDTDAVYWAFKQGIKNIRLDDNKIYNITPDVIEVNGSFNIEAGSAQIICDGIAIKFINGNNSSWNGGVLKSKSIPYTVVYDNNFNITEQGFMGYGRMPYQDEINVDSSYYYQKISCIIVFCSNSPNVLDGLTISNVVGSYASIVAAGYRNTKWDNCKIRGGSLSGAIVILNDCQLPITPGFGWNNGQNNSYGNSFKWGRGNNHSFINCDLYESRQQGLFLTGSDNITLTNCNTYNNSESGIQSGQYNSSYPEESVVCKHISQIGCKSWGNYYDGYDHATITSGVNGPFFEKHLIISNCQSYGNRATGLFLQGNDMTIIDNDIHDNGTHGIRVVDSSIVKIINNTSINNGILGGGYQIAAVGSDTLLDNNYVIKSNLINSHLLNISIGLQTIINYGVRLYNTPINIFSSPTTVLGNGVDINSTILTSENETVSYAGIRTSSYLPSPKAGKTETYYINNEAGALTAWKHPYSGAYLRLFTDNLTQSQTSGISFSYNWGKNSTNPTGYYDNAGIGGTKFTLGRSSFSFDIHDTGSITNIGGITIGVNSIRPNFDNTISCGESSYRYTNIFSVNSTISTSDARLKKNVRNLSNTEYECFYKISKLPIIWNWIENYNDDLIHSGPIVQDVISILEQYNLKWVDYGFIFYDDKTDIYSFRKEELIFLILGSISRKQDELEQKITNLYNKE